MERATISTFVVCFAIAVGSPSNAGNTDGQQRAQQLYVSAWKCVLHDSDHALEIINEAIALEPSEGTYWAREGIYSAQPR